MNTQFTLIAAIGLSCSMVMANTLADTLPDPTRPAGARPAIAAVVNTIRVEAIMISDTTQWAIINGTVVHRGDHIANAVIEEISRYSVRYSRNGHNEVALLPHATLQVRRNDTPEDSP